MKNIVINKKITTKVLLTLGRMNLPQKLKKKVMDLVNVRNRFSLHVDGTPLVCCRQWLLGVVLSFGKVP